MQHFVQNFLHRSVHRCTIRCMAQLEAVPHHNKLLTTGERLKLARERAGYSPGAFAAAVGKHRNNVARWEARNGDPSLPTIRMYVETCGNTTEEWLTFEIGDWPTHIARYMSAA